jgi:preprotein translocase subunit SecE
MADIPRTATVQSPLQIYKRGQGYYTRVGTAVGAGVLLAGMFHFLWSNIDFDSNAAWTQWLKVGIPLVVTVALAVLVYWLVGVNRSTADFLIATDGEMKKVNWTSRREIIAATKVVIVVTVLMALILFGVDYAFMQFFRSIGVLRTGG